MCPHVTHAVGALLPEQRVTRADEEVAALSAAQGLEPLVPPGLVHVVVGLAVAVSVTKTSPLPRLTGVRLQFSMSPWRLDARSWS